jgi:hypothetical protein
MRTRAMGQDAPYGAAPRPFRAIVALDPKKIRPFLWLAESSSKCITLRL